MQIVMRRAALRMRQREQVYGGSEMTFLAIDSKTIRDARRFVKYALRLSIWEPRWLSEVERRKRRAANERRKKLLREIGAGLRQDFHERRRCAAGQ